MKKILILLAVLFLGSCGTSNQLNTTMKNQLFQKWELTEFNGDKLSTLRPIYLELTRDNSVNGFVGCNSLMGNFSVDNRKNLNFNKLGSTKILCGKNEMNTENKVMNFLNKVRSIDLDGEKLVMKDEDGATAKFMPMHTNSIVNKYWKLKELDGQKVKMAEYQEREQFFILRSDNSIYGFSGCNNFSGTYSLEGDYQIKIDENLAVTKKACPDVNVDEVKLLEVFKLANNYSIDGDELSLNIGRRAPLAIFEAVYF